MHRNYIENNPVKAGLASFAEEFPFGSAHLKKLKREGAAANHENDIDANELSRRG
jgi:hypothetical protein